MKLDNPQLTVRHWEEDEKLSHPRPILLDTHLRTDFTKCRAQKVIVCCSEEAAARYNNSNNCSCRSNGYWMEFSTSYSCNDDSNGRTAITLLPCATKTCQAIRHGEEVTEEILDLNDVLHKLYDNFHIKSVMVEGGARVLSNFIEEQLVDCLCVTIAPTILAAGKGLAAFAHLLSFTTGDTRSCSLTDVHWKQLGVDGILCGRLS
jgi:riboflavin biosynthesis pyrimidine reductase